MTELMKQLQVWADEGRYNFEHDAFNWLGIDIINPDWIDWMTLVKLVCDGTIQVLRPVEHYPLPIEPEKDLTLCRHDNTEYKEYTIMCLLKTPHGNVRRIVTPFYHYCVDEDGEIYNSGTVLYKGLKSSDNPRHITHWQPLASTEGVV